MESHDYETNRNLTLMFFLEKLLVASPSSRSLHDLSCQFGTRGFSREMRQIAGGSQAGLRRFLANYPSLFSVDGDEVRIADPSGGGGGGSSSRSPEGSSSARDYTREAIDYFKARLKAYGPETEVPIRSLLGHRSQAPPEVRHVSGQHVKEFKEFLANFPEEFVLGEDDDDDQVIYLKEYEGQRRRHRPLAAEEAKPDPKMTSKILCFVRELVLRRGSLELEEGFELAMSRFGGEEESQLPFRRCQDFDTFLKMHSHLFRVHAGEVELVPARAQFPEAAPAPPARSQSLRQRVNSVVMKALADNGDCSWNGEDCGGGGRRSSSELASKESIVRASRVIATAREAAQVVEHVMGGATWRRPAVVAVDCEGINLGTKGQLTLLQMATMDKKAYIFDFVSDASQSMWTEGGLKNLLQSPNVVKVFHDCRNDSGVLHAQNGIHLQNVFDTQAAYVVLELQEFGRPVYKAKNISLVGLCETYGGSCNPVKDQVKACYRRDQRFWTRRPLTVDMVCYAAADVLCLVPEIYHAVNSAMKPEFINLFGELCEEQVMLHIDPEAVKAKKKQRKVDFEISDLRLKLANTAGGKSIVLSNREIRLLRHVELTEEDKDRLKGSYKVAKKLEKLESKQRQNESDDDEDSDRENGDVSVNEQDLPSLESVASDGGSSTGLSFASPTSPAALRSPSCDATSPSSTQPSSLQRLPAMSLRDSMELVNDILADTTLDRTERIEKLESVLTDMTEAMAADKPSGVGEKVSVATQTVSTGDINITKVYSEPT